MTATGLRLRCPRCLQPDFSCFCSWLKPLDPRIEFVILIHPIEVKRRRIVTGRLSHLSLVGSKLIMGQTFNGDSRILELLADPTRHCVMLYPGRQSANLSMMSEEARRVLIPAGKRLTVFVIDGTWSTAKKTVNQSGDLAKLPRICFTPSKPSNFRVRQQPRPDCYSTIEAIHEVIDLLGPAAGFEIGTRRHDQLLDIFSQMVDRQIELANSGKPSRRRPLV